MNTLIWKFPLTCPGDLNWVVTHEGAQILLVGPDPSGQLCLWLRFDPEQPEEQRRFRVYGTGHPMCDEAHEHVGSALVGSFVWHVFEIL